MSCRDRYGSEREGQDAARWGRRYDYEHLEHEHNAQYGEYDNCDVSYMRGYDREIRRQDDAREQERYEEEAMARRRHQDAVQAEQEQAEYEQAMEQEDQ